MNLARLRDTTSALLKKPEYFFLVVASVFGVSFLLIIPPFQTPDEHVHFYRAYEVSEVSVERGVENGIPGSMLPASIKKTVEAANAVSDVPTHIQFNPYNKYHLGYTKDALFNIPLDKNKKAFYETYTFPAIVYIPQATAVVLGKLFNAPIIVMLYMTRLVNLCVWLAIVFFCIKYFPWKKWALVGICLLPVVVSQTISPGLDVVAISSTLVFLTLIFKGVQDRSYKFTAKTLLLLAVAAIFMIFTKATLAVLFPLIFLVKSKQITLRYGGWLRIAVILLPIVAYVVWSAMSESSSQGISPRQQMEIFVHNPLHFLRLFVYSTFFITNAGNAVAQSLIGNFGWLDTPLSPPVIYISVAYLAFLYFVSVRNGGASIVKRDRLLISFAALGLVLSTFLAMYIYSTLPIDNNIKGVQGRYLVPVMIMLIPVLLNRYILTSKEVYVRVVQVMSVGVLILSVLTIIARYYFVYIPT